VSASFEIQSATGSYAVIIQKGLFAETIAPGPGRLFFADQYFEADLRARGVDPIVIEASETVKSLDAMPAVITGMRKRGANRQTELVAVGGGIVQDVAAFAASVFMRGIAWNYVPTTVLAMSDSCIGGKSSINVGPYKNLIGTFHQPKEIFIDPLLADSLTLEQRAAGLVEAGKICFCRGEEAFEEYLTLAPTAAMDGAALEPIVRASLLAKKWFVEKDEFDQAERLLLNFGHTFGHAIEGATHFQVSHGIAVAVGILCALEFRRAAGGKDNSLISALDRHMRDLLKTSPGLQAELAAVSVTDVVERIQADKKHTRTHYTLILPGANGEIALTRHEKSDAVAERLAAAVKAAIGTLDPGFLLSAA
jgi:3-dehydroquinate synthase